MIRTALLLLAAALPIAAQEDPAWKDLAFLTGKWVSDNAQGDCTFEPDLDRHVLVRRSEANLPNAPKHTDLMVIYLENGPRAIYFDNEGHIIHYTVSFPGPERAVFEAPQFRLTYRMEKGLLKGKFEIGGKPYLEWTTRRQ